MKTIKYIGMMMMAAGMLTATSCSDFDDYNTVPSDAVASSQKTLWENISTNPDLTDFAALVEKAGFADELQSSTFYTVWAPKNGTYDASALMNEDAETLLGHFVKNHIASYNHLAVGTIDDRVRSLNQKSHVFSGNGTYHFSDIAISQPNLPSSNGTLHVLDGSSEFYPNISEFLSLKKNLSDDLTVDSVCNYFLKYQLSYLDEENSVIGPIVDGKQTYIDSVMTVYNSVLNRLYVNSAEEDSSYVWFIPTDKAWDASYSKMKSAFKYATTTNAQQLIDNNTVTTNSVSATVDAEFMQDSLAKYNLVRNLFYSANDDYNKWLVGGDKLYLDSIRITGRSSFRSVLSGAETSILPHVKQDVIFSNGIGKIVDSVAFHPWETYNPEIWEGARANMARVLNGSTVTKGLTIVKEDGTTEEFTYLHVAPTSNYSKPELDIYLPDVLATTYNIYCVIIPSIYEGASENKPNQLDFKLSYADASGNLKADYTLATKLENDPTRIDTMYVGQFTFPTCYAGLGDEIAPNIKITSPFSAFNKTLMNTYTRDLRIAAIIMRPVEYDEFLATKE